MAAIIHLLWLVLMLSWSLEDVNSQTFPNVSFRGQTLANHSYVNLSLVGYDRNDSVQCITDQGTCCGNTEGPHRGDWYFPNGIRLPFSGDIFESLGSERVALRHSNNANSPVGIYRCDIPTNAVHVDGGNSLRATVYVGLYTASGGIYVPHACHDKTSFFTCPINSREHCVLMMDTALI